MRGLTLEPALFILDVSSNEVFVGFGEVDNAFYQTDDSARPAGYECNNYLDDALGGVAENELVNTKATYQDAEDACDDFLVATELFPVGHLSRID